MVRARRRPESGSGNGGSAGTRKPASEIHEGELCGTPGDGKPKGRKAKRPLRSVHQAGTQAPKAIVTSGPIEEAREIQDGAAPSGKALPPQELIDEIEATRRIEVHDWQSFLEHQGPKSAYLILGDRKATDISARPAIHYVDPADWPWSLKDLVASWINRKRIAAGLEFCGNRKQSHLLALPAPLYYEGGIQRGEFAYVDIDKCFYSLYRDVTYDLDFSVKTGALLQGKIMLEDSAWLASDPIARNSVVGIARRTMIRSMRNGSVHAENVFGPLCSPGLWAYIAFALSAIATQAIYLDGAIYVATDGYIVPAENAERLRNRLWSHWRLESTIEGLGASTVWGIGRYAVGEYRSQAIGGVPSPIKNLIDVDSSIANKLEGYRHGKE